MGGGGGGCNPYILCTGEGCRKDLSAMLLQMMDLTEQLQKCRSY